MSARKFASTPAHGSVIATHVTLSALSFGALMAVGAGAIEMFGDADAAGPMGRVSLIQEAPTVTIAGLRIADDVRRNGERGLPVGDLGEGGEARFYADGQPLEAGAEPLSADEMADISRLEAQTAESSAAARTTIEIVSADDSGFAQATRRNAVPSASALPKAPFPGLFERTANGTLPVRAPDGLNSVKGYAKPFLGDRSKPRIAVIIGGLGVNARQTEQAIKELPAEVTLAFVPYIDNLQGWIDRARADGHEVMLEIPMEPFDGSGADAGEYQLLADAPSGKNTERLEWLLGRATGYFGVTNYLGARFAGSAPAVSTFMGKVDQRGLAFIHDGGAQRSAFGTEAARRKVPFAVADRIIDQRPRADAIDEQLLQLEALALQKGAALGTGFAYPVTVDQLSAWTRDLAMKGYALAPASAVLGGGEQGRK